MCLSQLVTVETYHSGPIISCLQIKSGRWHGPEGKSHHVTQYHDVIGDNLGNWAKIVVQVVVVISLFGTNVSQIVASSSDAYYLEEGNSLNKRCAHPVWAVEQLTPAL